MPTLIHLRRTWPLAFLLASAISIHAQSGLENVIVETYYISNAADAVPTDGGILEEGSTTYRVFLDLCDSCTLLSIYGSAHHPLEISTTTLFHNNLDRGRTFGHELSNSWYDENTVALDSWLALGAANSSRFGILKSEDPDTGSEELFPNDLALLQNNDAAAGIPLTEADGLVQDTVTSPVPPSFFVVGISPDSVFRDSTQAATFFTDSTRISCQLPGMTGHGAGNKVLVAQLTTTGELTFCINVEIVLPGGTVVRYVSGDTLLADDEVASGLLCYPPVCGCTDPNFLEYDPTAGCDDGSCITPIVFGCLDTIACNFNPAANFHLDALCCYGPDSCNGLDVNIVCPGVGLEEAAFAGDALEVFPNPTSDHTTVRMNGHIGDTGVLSVHDQTGRIVLERSFTIADQDGSVVLDLSHLERGVYVLQVVRDGKRLVRTIVRS